MSLKWQNSIFYCLPNKGYQFWQLPIWKSASVEVRESSREVPVYQWVKKSKINQTLMRVRGTVLFYQCHFNHKMAQLSAKRKLLGLQFLPWGKLRAFKWTSGFPSCVEYCQKKKKKQQQKKTFISCPIQSTEYAAWLGTGTNWKNSSQGSQMVSRWFRSYRPLVDLIREPAHEFLGTPHLQAPPQ